MVTKNLEISYLLDFYGDVLTEKQRDVMEQYYNDDLSLSEIADTFGITRLGVPATSAQDAGVFHCGYNNDMTGVAPEASLISCRVDWTPYFVYAISAVANGESFDQDWTAGYADLLGLL